MAAEHIKETQLFLQERGYYKLAIDGVWGPASRRAYSDMLGVEEPKRRAIAAAKVFPKDTNGSKIAFYGQPHLVPLERVAFPWKATYEGKPVSSASVHKKLASDLRLIFKEVWELAQSESKVLKVSPQSLIDRWGLSTYNGSYNNRPVRNGTALSQHAFGAALDFDAGDNPNSLSQGGRKEATMPEKVIQIFANHGWMNGLRVWARDGMHMGAVQ